MIVNYANGINKIVGKRIVLLLRCEDFIFIFN